MSLKYRNTDKPCIHCGEIRITYGKKKCVCTRCHYKIYHDQKNICTFCKKEAPKSKQFCSPECYVKAGVFIDENGCWKWRKSKGVSTTWNRKRITVYRLSYETFIGAIPEGKFITHRCTNINCCNPQHLFAEERSEFLNRLRPIRRRFDKSVAGLQLCSKTNELIISKIREFIELGYTNFEITEIYNKRSEISFSNLNIKRFNQDNPPGFMDKKLFNFSDIEADILREANQELQEAYGTK